MIGNKIYCVIDKACKYHSRFEQLKVVLKVNLLQTLKYQNKPLYTRLIFHWWQEVDLESTLKLSDKPVSFTVINLRYFYGHPVINMTISGHSFF